MDGWTHESRMEALRAERDRLRAAVQFYAKHEHWMARSDQDGPEVVLVAGNRDSKEGHGWEVAEAALSGP